jgi:hypothetical protein
MHERCGIDVGRARVGQGRAQFGKARVPQGAALAQIVQSILGSMFTISARGPLVQRLQSGLAAMSRGNHT